MQSFEEYSALPFEEKQSLLEKLRDDQDSRKLFVERSFKYIDDASFERHLLNGVPEIERKWYREELEKRVTETLLNEIDNTLAESSSLYDEYVRRYPSVKDIYNGGFFALRVNTANLLPNIPTRVLLMPISFITRFQLIYFQTTAKDVSHREAGETDAEFYSKAFPLHDPASGEDDIVDKSANVSTQALVSLFRYARMTTPNARLPDVESYTKKNLKPTPAEEAFFETLKTPSPDQHAASLQLTARRGAPVPLFFDWLKTIEYLCQHEAMSFVPKIATIRYLANVLEQIQPNDLVRVFGFSRNYLDMSNEENLRVISEVKVSQAYLRDIRLGNASASTIVADRLEYLKYHPGSVDNLETTMENLSVRPDRKRKLEGEDDQ